MDGNKREFIKNIGAFSLWGLSAGALSQALFSTPAIADFDKSESSDLAATRWGMVVDLSKCRSDCDDCIQACHMGHNMPEIKSQKEEVKWVWKEKYENAFPHKTQQFLSQQKKDTPVLTLCNHCDNPPCVRVCPTQATFKRSDGIVEMDYHRCIGCRFCMAGCPYGSRSFNWRDPRPSIKELNRKYPTRERGVVEKCNFCSDQLAKGKQPICASVCKFGALTFGNLNDPNSEIRQLLNSKYTIQRKSDLGTKPSVFYIVEGNNG
jgi:molybdopterin-containing oxidoreductase family iron-sulfur binding subunit